MTSIWHLLDGEMGMNCKAGFQEHTVIHCDLWNFTATLGLRVSKQSASKPGYTQGDIQREMR